MGTGLR